MVYEPVFFLRRRSTNATLLFAPKWMIGEISLAKPASL
jgi:hypothetical protein